MLPSTSSQNGPRRIVAVVLTQLLCELAREHSIQTDDTDVESESADGRAMAVVLTREEASEQREFDGDSSTAEQLASTTKIHAINDAARTYGVRPGQTIAEACAWVSHLRVQTVSYKRLREALERVAECLMRFTPIVSIDSHPFLDFDVEGNDALERCLEFDTVWLDVTGTTHLFGGESMLLQEIAAHVVDLGHACRLAVSEGPLLARAFARWHAIGRKHGLSVPANETSRWAGELPINALPVAADLRRWLARLGMLQLSDLAKLPHEQLTARLGTTARIALDLIEGRDTHPVHPYKPPQLPHEYIRWDEPAVGSEPLLFALRGLTSRISARLEGRAMAVQSLKLIVEYDRGVARFRQLEPEISFPYDFASPIAHAEDLWRITSAKLTKARLQAPSVGLRIEVTSLVEAPKRQLDLLTLTSNLQQPDPEKLQVLFSELAADIGAERFGTLRVRNSHRPEVVSVLQPVALTASKRSSNPQRPSKRGSRKGAKKSRRDTSGQNAYGQFAFESMPTASLGTDTSSPAGVLSFDGRVPNRLLQPPSSISVPFRKGELMPVGGKLYTVSQISFEHRLDCVEWWSGNEISRDYLRLSLTNDEGLLEALVFKDRVTGKRYLQAIYD